MKKTIITTTNEISLLENFNYNVKIIRLSDGYSFLTSYSTDIKNDPKKYLVNDNIGNYEEFVEEHIKTKRIVTNDGLVCFLVSNVETKYIAIYDILSGNENITYDTITFDYDESSSYSKDVIPTKFHFIACEKNDLGNLIPAKDVLFFDDNGCHFFVDMHADYIDGVSTDEYGYFKSSENVMNSIQSFLFERDFLITIKIRDAAGNYYDFQLNDDFNTYFSSDKILSINNMNDYLDDSEDDVIEFSPDRYEFKNVKILEESPNLLWMEVVC